MNKFWKVLGITALAGALLLAGSGFVAAQTATPPAPQASWGPGWMMGGMMGWGGFRWAGPQNSLIAVAAEALGLTPQELIAELQAGKTIADVAEEQGVTLEAIVDAFLAPREAALQAAVEAGRLTQEQANALLAQIRERVRTRLTATWTFRQGYGPGFMDENGNGICDPMEFGAGGFGLGTGRFGPTGRGMMGRGWSR